MKDRIYSQSAVRSGTPELRPCFCPNVSRLLPRPHLSRWRRYRGRWTTWRAYRPLTTTTPQPAGRVLIGAGSGSRQQPPRQPPRSLSAPGSRPWQVPGGGLGWEGEGRGLLGWRLCTSTLENLGGLEDVKECHGHFACESIDQHRPMEHSAVTGKCSLSLMSNI